MGWIAKPAGPVTSQCRLAALYEVLQRHAVGEDLPFGPGREVAHALSLLRPACLFVKLRSGRLLPKDDASQTPCGFTRWLLQKRSKTH